MNEGRGVNRLDTIKARAAVVAGKPDNCEPTEKEFDALIDGAVHDVPTLVAALEAVLELHKPEPEPNTMTWEGRYLCSQCVYIDDRGEPSAESYPCPTVQAIQSALGEEEK